MKPRRIASLCALLSFAATILTSIILYITPQGRVAYWSDWRLWGLDKEQWGALHINLGFLFIAALIWHIYYNWKPLLNYLKDKTRKLKVFNKEFSIALAVVAMTAAGTWMEIPPFSSIIHISEGFQDRAAARYGEPPYGHAELSTLKGFAQKMALDPQESLEALSRAGLKVSGVDQPLVDIARANGLSPQAIYEAMRPASEPKNSGKPEPWPDSPPPGTGRLTLEELAARHGLNAQELVQILDRRGIRGAPDMTLKEIAEQNGLGATQVYEAAASAAQAP